MGNPVVLFGLLLFTTVGFVTSQNCPNRWVGHASMCYRFVYTTKLPWRDARNFCSLHGGDLAKIGTVSDRNWLIGRARSYSNRQKMTNRWWTGLNNLEYLSSWEWADGSAVNSSVINWSPGEPNNWKNQERCGEIYTNNKFNDQNCQTALSFICSRNRGDPVMCDANTGWQILNGQCYRVYGGRRSWYSGNRQCNHDGGSMVNIDSLILEITLHDLATSAKQPLWLGLHSLQMSSTTANWVWTPNNTILDIPYWNAGKPPVLDRAHLNRSCAAISNIGSPFSAWNALSCSSPRGLVCQKPEGMCFPGWIGHRGTCYQFNPHFHLGFDGADNFCRSQGAMLSTITFSSDQAFVNSYLSEMHDGGSDSFWIGLSDNNKDEGPYVWRNNQTTRRYRNWATPKNQPTNTPDKIDCVYISTSDVKGKWRITTSCQSAKSFICTAPMGTSVHFPPSTPSPVFGCPDGWKLHAGVCFKIYTIKNDAFTARQSCQSTQGADLAKIVDEGTQSFLNGILPKSQSFYIGLNDRHVNGVFTWNDETTVANYTNWRKGEPNDYRGRPENCVVLNQQWNDIPCNSQLQFICSMLANSVFIQVPHTIPPDWTIKCGAGWESNPLSDSCYLFSDEPLSWTDSRLQCQAYGGDLVSIESLGEQNYLAGRLTSMHSLSVWTGANDRQTEGGWNWASGSGFAFVNWAAGSPGGTKGQSTDCVAMLTTTAMWDDLSCNERNGYICEKRGNVPTTQPPATKAISVPAGMALGCVSGWLPFGNSCYKVLRIKYSWTQASTFCSKRNAYLASITNANEQNFLQANIPKSNTTAIGYWLGLNDKKDDNSFVWTDGSKVVYTNWNRNEPNNWENRNEDCVLFLMQNGKWNDKWCSYLASGFVCKRPKQAVSVTQAPWAQGCPLYALGYGPYCYRFIGGGPRSWLAANAFCNTTFKGNLATVNDRYLQAFLSSQLARRTGRYWIGLSDQTSPGTYAWKSGYKIKYTNWNKNHTGNEKSTCISMRANVPIGFWDNLDCSQKNNYICEFGRQGYTHPPSPPTPWPNVPCPTGWTAYLGFCYQAFCQQAQKTNWMGSVGFCQSMGGDLPSLHSKDQESFLRNFTQNCNATTIWLGMNDRGTEGGMMWSDGSPVDYTNWNKGEPNNWGASEDCGSISKTRQGWNDLNCYYTEGYVCSLPRGAQPMTTPVPPTGITSSQCGSDATWLLFNGSCYFRSPVSGDNATLSWYDASNVCNSHFSTLVSIHSASELEFLMGSFSLSGAWIGLSILGGGSYKWSDGTPLDYANWMPNEPNNYGGVENCAHLYKTGKWNDNLCQNKHIYACKKPFNGVATRAVPSPNPVGGCRNGFTRAPGGRNKCFYLGGGTNITRRNFSSARTFCRSFGPGYDLASIEDNYELEFILSMADGYASNLWIGLADNRGNNQFYWQNGAPLIFTNWDNNMPKSSHPDNPNKKIQNCVMMLLNQKGHEGRWRDVVCPRTMAFVCQSNQDPIAPVLPVSASNCFNPNYKSFREGCYKISSTVKSWNDAGTDCHNDGGHLVSINDAIESAFVVTLAAKKAPFWIGLSDIAVPGLYGWSDGWPVQYSSWSSGEPQFTQGVGHGCVVSDQNGKWNDSDCFSQFNYVCKIFSGSPPQTPPPTSGNCSKSYQIPFGDYCYYVSSNRALSWPDASYNCAKMGMRLASVHGDNEMGFILNLAQQSGPSNPSNNPNLWIGLSKKANGAYQWSDQTGVNYLNWRPGQPSTLGNNGQLEECIEINRDHGLWDDISCFYKRRYICKALKAFATSPGPFTFPPVTQAPLTFPVVTPAPFTFPVVTPAPVTQGPPPLTRYFIFGTKPTPAPLTFRIPVFTLPRNPPPVYTNRPPFIQTTYNPFNPPVSQITYYPFNQPVSLFNPGVTNAPLQQTGNTADRSSSSGMSGGAIAGVIIGVLVILAAAGLLGMYLRKSGKMRGISGALGFDNAAYKNETEDIQLESDA